MSRVNIVTDDNLATDLTVEVLSIHAGSMKTIVITDEADGQQVMVYEDEIENLIAALIELKGEIK